TRKIVACKSAERSASRVIESATAREPSWSNVSLAGQAVRGAVWTIALSVGSRAVGVVTTIAIAYFIAPEVDGEVKAAWFIAILASTGTRFGFDQYLIVKQHDGDDVPFHCTFYMALMGVLSLGAVVIFDGFFASLL